MSDMLRIEREQEEWHITAVLASGSTVDVTPSWSRFINLRRESYDKLSAFLKKYDEMPDDAVATYELLVESDVGLVFKTFFSKPTMPLLKLYAPGGDVVVRAILKTGAVKVVSTEFREFFGLVRLLP